MDNIDKTKQYRKVSLREEVLGACNENKRKIGLWTTVKLGLMKDMIEFDSKKIEDEFYLSDGLIVEAKDFKFPINKSGGIIVFSTDINVQNGQKTFRDEIKFWIQDKFQTIVNSCEVMSKATKNVGRNLENKDYGFTIGKFFQGGYKAKSRKLFNDKSVSIEIIGITSALLLKIATEIARDFSQETVLVKDYQSNETYFVNVL